MRGKYTVKYELYGEEREYITLKEEYAYTVAKRVNRMKNIPVTILFNGELLDQFLVGDTRSKRN